MKKNHAIPIAIIILVGALFLLMLLLPSKSRSPVIPEFDTPAVPRDTTRDTEPQNRPNSDTSPSSPGTAGTNGGGNTGTNSTSTSPGAPSTSTTLPRFRLPSDGNVTAPNLDLPPNTSTESGSQPLPEVNPPDLEPIGGPLSGGSGTVLSLPQDEEGVTVNPSGETGTLSSIRVYNITAQEWSFTPQTITANVGDTIRMNFGSLDSAHCASVPSYNQFVDIPAGESASLEFTVDRAGSFSFFCPLSYSENRSDMNGTLIVNE